MNFLPIEKKAQILQLLVECYPVLEQAEAACLEYQGSVIRIIKAKG